MFIGKVTDKKFMTPEGIEDLKENSWRSSCSCYAPDHAVTIWLEADENIPEVWMVMKTGKYIERDSFTGVFEVIWKRLKAACSILFLGRIETNGSFIFRDEDHLYDFATLFNWLGKNIENYKGYLTKEQK